MGKIVALGGGDFDNGEMLEVAKLIVSFSRAEKPTLIYLPTAGHDNLDGDEPIFNIFEGLGCRVRPLLLTDESLTADEIEKTILGADIVYAGGGNLEFLMDTWKRTGADKLLVKAFENGTVLSGLSSGAMCWFHSGYDNCGVDGAFMFVECVGLIPFCNCPHFEGESWQSFSTAIKTREVSGIAAENGAAFVYDDGKYGTICGSNGGDVYLFDVSKGFEKICLTGCADEILKEVRI